MCGAISTKCNTNNCDGWARYDIYCIKCMDSRVVARRIFLRRGE